MARAATAAVRLLTGEREPVRLATTANITTVEVDGLDVIQGLQTVDGVLTEVGDRVLVKDQTNQTINGIYVASVGTWRRASDARSARSMQKGTTVHVQQGTANSGNVYSFQTYEPNLGTDNIVLALYMTDAAAQDVMDAKVAAEAAAVLTAADRTQTGLDRIATAADRVQTGLDKTATNADAIATAADRVQTGLDRVATAADRVQTGLDAAAADAARIAAESAAGATTPVAAQIVAASNAVSLDDADLVGNVDVSGSNILYKRTWAQIKAFLFASTTLTGNPTAPTQSQADNSTRLATTAYVRAAITAILNGVAAAYDTLAEIAAELALKANLTAIRDKLTANRTYYVRTDGSDSNTGLVNTSGGAFLTVQKAVDVAAACDLSVYEITIQVADGTYTGAVVFKNYVGDGPVTIRGNVTTPSNVLISTTNDAFGGNAVTGLYRLTGLKIVSSGGQAIDVTSCNVQFEVIDFGACVSHLRARGYALIKATGNYTISGGGTIHLDAGDKAIIDISGPNPPITVTLTGTPAFSSWFAGATFDAIVKAQSVTFTGSATGKRYTASQTAMVYTAAGGASYLPGSIAGTVADDGQYL